MEYNWFSKMPPSLSEKQKAKNKHANKQKSQKNKQNTA